MAKQLDVGVSNVARKGKKGWCGVGDKARKVKKMWVGDANGKARLFFSGGEIAYYGKIKELCMERYDLAAASVGNYALFAGGYNNLPGFSDTSNARRAVVDAYNTSLTRSEPSFLKKGVDDLAGASVGNYALFAGGSYGNGDVDYVQSYDSSLTYSLLSTALSEPKNNHAAASVGNYALFAGGRNVSYDSYASVDAYNNALTKSTANNLSVARYDFAATLVGDYALFAGGCDYYTHYYSTVDAYNKSLTKCSVSELSVARRNHAAASVGNYALFVGGQYGDGSKYTAITEVYNASLTRSTAPDTSIKSNYWKAATVGDYALFVTSTLNTSVGDVANIYDSSLTMITSTLVDERIHHAVASVGDYALVAGGHPSNTYGTLWASVEAFKVA